MSGIEGSRQKEGGVVEQGPYEVRPCDRDILDMLPDIVAKTDASKVFTWMNEAGHEFFGEDATGKETSHYFAGEQDDYAALSPMSAGDTDSFYVENWQKRADGAKRLLAWWYRPLTDEGGATVGYLATARDITEGRRATMEWRRQLDELSEWRNGVLSGTGRTKALKEQVAEVLNLLSERIPYPDPDIDGLIRQVVREGSEEGLHVETQLQLLVALLGALEEQTRSRAALEESERRLHRLGANLPDGAIFQVVLEPDGKRRFIHYTAGERDARVPEMHMSADPSLLYNNLDPEELERVKEAEAISARDLTIFDVEVREIAPDGGERWAWVHSMPRRLEDGSTIWDGVKLDITKRKQDEAAVERLRYLIGQLDDYPTWLDSEGRIIEVSESTCRHLGYTREELLSMTLFDLDPYASPETFAADWEHQRAIAPHVHEGIHRTKSGHEYPVEVSVAFAEFGGEEYQCSFCRDITKRKIIEEERARLEAQLAQSGKMESLGQLAGGVAHDFNNMLCVIQGHAELAKGRLDPSHPAGEDLRQIANAAARSAGVVQQLLAFARKQVVSPKVVDLNETVEDSLKMLRRLIGEHIDLVWLPGDGPLTVEIDPTQVNQILANLCVNARDAIQGGGSITVSTSIETVDEEGGPDRPGFVAGDYVMLSVTDTGRGMDEATKARLFEPFFTTRERGKGTGLGLPMVYGIVKQNEGFVYVDSVLGEGTTFEIYLRRVEGVENTRPLQEEVSIPRGRGETILVVEDEESLLKVVEALLRRLNYKILGATRPSEALSLLEEHGDEIALVLTDIVMPEMNGYELAQKMEGVHPGLKTVFMSGYTGEAINERGMLTKGVRLIQKPFSVEEVATALRRTIDEEPGAEVG